MNAITATYHLPVNPHFKKDKVRGTPVGWSFLAGTAPGGRSLTPQDKGSLGKKKKLPVLFVSTLKAALLFRAPYLFYYAQFFANFGEGGNALIQVRALVGGRDLYADAGLSLGNYRVVETGNVNTFVQQTGSHVLA